VCGILLLSDMLANRNSVTVLQVCTHIHVSVVQVGYSLDQ